MINISKSTEENVLGNRRNGTYGAVYTPDSLADFVASLIVEPSASTKETTILDPSSGELSLLSAIHNHTRSNNKNKLIGVDVDPDAIAASKRTPLAAQAEVELIEDDFILPEANKEVTSEKYWNAKLNLVDKIISNPPWSTERIYPSALLKERGFSLVRGQYDAYVLFIELSLKLLKPDGVAAFILPDSIFGNTSEELRKFLSKNYRIRVIARLGEKIFPEVNRATAVIVLQNSKPDESTLCTCFRLDTHARIRVLKGKSDLYSEFKKSAHMVRQARFSNSANFSFDIDTKEHEEAILLKIRSNTSEMNDLFSFGRGVEISKSGAVIECPYCKNHQGTSPKQRTQGMKRCSKCGSEISTKNPKRVLGRKKSFGDVPIYAGEDVRRYCLVDGRYLKLGIKGISYKDSANYAGPKILVRKTGLGINASIDTGGAYSTQTVYILRLKSGIADDNVLWYYLALLNSRVVFYYYLKVFGENEWKSHPYLTKSTLYQLPLFDHNLLTEHLVQKVATLAERLQNSYSKELDVSLESIIHDIYGLDERERELIRADLSRLPELTSIEGMKY